jgi:hypothetical protein
MTGETRVVPVADIIYEREHWEIEAGYGPGEYQKACRRRVDICNLALAAAPAEQAAPSPTTGCPCTLTTPCGPNCTCSNPDLSGGCLRCCSYGSLDQRKAMAMWLASALTPAINYSRVAATSASDLTAPSPASPSVAVRLCESDGKPCPAPRDGKGRGNSRCEQNGLCQRININDLPRLNVGPNLELSVTASDSPKGANAPEEAAAHTDHPLRHYDRTCPACNEKGADAPANAADPRLLLNPITLRTEPWSTDLITENENLSSELLDVRDKLSASDKENSSLRAECRLRQIAGYAKGKFDQDSVIDELKGKLAAAKRERDQLREWQTRANSCMDKLEARAEAAELRAEQIAAETIEQCTEVCDAMILTIGDKEISGMHERADGCKNGLENAARKIRALSAADIYAAIAGKRKE